VVQRSFASSMVFDFDFEIRQRVRPGYFYVSGTIWNPRERIEYPCGESDYGANQRGNPRLNAAE
jgi:hypothetical protein